jgi:hypothetical protein
MVETWDRDNFAFVPKKKKDIMLHKKVEDRSGGVSFFYMIRTLAMVKPTINSIVSILHFLL